MDGQFERKNTLLLALEDGQRAYRVRHSKVMMRFRLEELSKFLAITQETLHGLPIREPKRGVKLGDTFG